MSAGLASTLMLDLAASHGDDLRRGARERAQTAVAERSKVSRRLTLRNR